MGEVDKLLSLYTRMRDQGMQTGQALDVLAEAISSLDQPQRAALEQDIRSFETARINQPDPVEWITCPHCQRQNRKGESLCYSCGQLLATRTTEYITQILETDFDTEPGDTYFGPESLLILVVRHNQKDYVLRPQDSAEALVVGRSSRGPVVPDIDLSDSDGNRLGVSRQHLSVRYDTQYHTVTVFDLGSANGTFINGHRLHPHEVRVLHHDDELRLGNMLLRVMFRHTSRHEPY
jgi:hypothetical protein